MTNCWHTLQLRFRLSLAIEFVLWKDWGEGKGTNIPICKLPTRTRETVVSEESPSGRFSVLFQIPKKTREGMGYDIFFLVLSPCPYTCWWSGLDEQQEFPKPISTVYNICISNQKIYFLSSSAGSSLSSTVF